MELQRITIGWTHSDDDGSHRCRLRRIPGLFRDRIELAVDDEIMVSQPAGSWMGAGESGFSLDDRPCLLRWQWNRLRGDPASIELTKAGAVLFRYGRGAEH